MSYLSMCDDGKARSLMASVPWSNSCPRQEKVPFGSKQNLFLKSSLKRKIISSKYLFLSRGDCLSSGSALVGK